MISNLQKMRKVAQNQLKQIAKGILPKHKHLVTDINFLKKFLNDTKGKCENSQ